MKQLFLMLLLINLNLFCAEKYKNKAAIHLTVYKGENLISYKYKLDNNEIEEVYAEKCKNLNTGETYWIYTFIDYINKEIIPGEVAKEEFNRLVSKFRSSPEESQDEYESKNAKMIARIIRPF